VPTIDHTRSLADVGSLLLGRTYLLRRRGVGIGVPGTAEDVFVVGRIDPDRMETIMNELLLDFFNKYLLGQPARLIDGEILPEEIIFCRK